MHVPFAVRAPFSLMAHRRVADPVRSVDIMPTALDLLGVQPPAGISGVSLAPLMAGATPELGLEAYSEAMYPLHHYGWSDLRALRSGRYKVIDAPRPELYDVDRDPAEATNIFQERQQLGDRLIAELRALEGKFTRTEASLPPGDVDPEARERLAALGYVGSFVATAADPRTDRADPKDKIGLFNKLGDAIELSKEKDAEGRPPFKAIVALLDQVVAEDPQVIDAWFMMGTQYMAHGDLEKAVGYFKRTLTLKPDYDLAVFNLAQAYRRMGDDEAALAGFEHYLTLDPKDPFVQYQMGEIWLDRGDLPRAEQLFRRALEIDGQVVAAKNALGVIALQRGDPATAERLIREAIAVKPTLRLAHFNLGLLAEQRGDLPGAEREYLRGAQGTPRKLQGRLQHVAPLRAGRGSRRPDRRAQAVDPEQSALRRRLHLPREGVPRRGNEPAGGDRARGEGAGVRAALRQRGPGPLRAGGPVQPRRPPPRRRAGSGPRPGAAGARQAGETVDRAGRQPLSR